MTDLELMRLAEDARAYSYTPYSGFAVGAALLTKSGKVYTGCNIENASYTPTVCAERTAVFKAVSEGEKEFAAIAIIGGPAGEKGRFCAPCGVCRQVLREFCELDFRILLGSVDKVQAYTLGELLPTSFGPLDLKGE
ncbi:MAG: cytidine deaminase [Ruminococcaceae bacterium]|nr:cytidine deaminase [Oscillospiraceae bacterium]